MVLQGVAMGSDSILQGQKSLSAGQSATIRVSHKGAIFLRDLSADESLPALEVTAFGSVVRIPKPSTSIVQRGFYGGVTDPLGGTYFYYLNPGLFLGLDMEFQIKITAPLGDDLQIILMDVQEYINYL